MKYLLSLLLILVGCIGEQEKLSKESSETGMSYSVKRLNNTLNEEYEITYGDEVWYLSDKYNGNSSLGAGRLRLRNTKYKGKLLLTHSDIDYSLQVSNTMTGPKYWVGNQAGGEGDRATQVLLLDDLLSDIALGVTVVTDKVQFRFSTIYYQSNDNPFMQADWQYTWENGKYRFKLDVTYLNHLCRWTEYTSHTPHIGDCDTTVSNAWRAHRVETENNNYTGLGCKTAPSSYTFEPSGNTFETYLTSGSDEVMVTTYKSETGQLMVANKAASQWAPEMVITYHIGNDGTSAIEQHRGDIMTREHEITIEDISQ